MATVTRIALAGALLLLSVAGTTLAGTTERFEDAFTIEKTYPCGVVEATEVSLVGTAFFDADGEWIRDQIRFEFDGTLTDPTDDESVELKGRQVALVQPGELALVGQGFFIRLPGTGVVLHDVGRLVINLEDGSTIFASAGVLTFEDMALADAAVCAQFS
jgi:hypothetical protein